jgi:type VI secretion system secreted protein VgrG
MIKDATVREELGRMSTMDLDMLSPDESLALDDLLGRGFSVELALDGDTPRYFHGVVAECSQIGRFGRFARYTAKVVPWLWLLTRTSDCRIFQQKSIPDIIKSVFREHGTADFEDSLTGSYSPRDYCVQYMETDFDFVSRLMEQEGIYYFFRHDKDKDTLVLCDSAGAHRATPGCETLSYYPPSENVVREDDHIGRWLLSHSMQSGKLSHTDFDFIKPRTSLLAQHVTVGTYPKSDAEVFTYPGGYATVGDGGRYAQRRLEALQQQHERVVGGGNARALAVGALFSLENHPREDQNREYLVVATVHHFSGTDYESGVAHASADVTVSFDAIPSLQPYRSLPTTRRARVAGPQTAIVVGKAGEEIYTDQYGRVKVQFHWDRLGKRDENSSCWVRVSQVWAGKNWGAMHIPRIGQEVVVDFLEGDPDRPIITGRVYNAAEMPPYDLPANQTQSGIKSRSSKGGSPANFNEIRFEDKMGSEMLTIHAEKDQEILVENNETHSVGSNRSKSVGHDETTKVAHDRTETVGNNETIAILASQSVSVGGNRTILVERAAAETIALAKALSIGLAYQVSVGAGMNETVGAAQITEVGGYRAENVVGYKTTNVGKKISVNSDEEIVLRTGDSQISMKKDGTIEISGKDVTMKTPGGTVHIKNDGTIEISGSDATMKTSAGTTHIDAGGIITIKGAMVKINT